MDSIKIQKHQAMRNYKIKAQILCIKIAVYSLAAFISSLFYLYLFWFPTMKHFISMYLPSIYSLLSSSKFLFILANLIVVTLIGDCKLRSDNSISSREEIYDEYFIKSRGLGHTKKQRSMSTNGINKNVQEIVMVHDSLRTATSCSMILHGVTGPKKSMASDQFHHPLKPVKSCNKILYGVTDPMKSMPSEQVMHPLKTLKSCNKVLRGEVDPKKSMAPDQFQHPLKSVTPCDKILHGVTDPKKSMASNQVIHSLKTLKPCKKVLFGITDPKKSMASDQVIHPLKIIATSDLVLHNIIDLKKLKTSKTQGQRKRPKRHVLEKIAITRLDHEDESNIIFAAQEIEFVDKVEDTELPKSRKESKWNGKEEEKVDVHHDSEKEEEEIDVYHDHDSVQRDELNKRAEEFIARVTRRRMLEAGQLVFIGDS